MPLKPILYFAIGFIGVWLSTKRTINVVDGHYLMVIPISLSASISMYYFTYAVANKDFTFMFFNAIGAAFAVHRLAIKRNTKKNK